MSRSQSSSYLEQNMGFRRLRAGPFNNPVSAGAVVLTRFPGRFQAALDQVADLSVRYKS